MTDKEKFEGIQYLTGLLNQYNQKGNLKFTVEDGQLLKSIYSPIFQVYNLSLSCSSCILHYLNSLLSYYEREYPLYQKSIQPEMKEDKPIKKKK